MLADPRNVVYRSQEKAWSTSKINLPTTDFLVEVRKAVQASGLPA